MSAGGAPAWAFDSPRRYRAAIRRGRLSQGIEFAGAFDATRPTVVFIPASSGSPGSFRAFAKHLQTTWNCGVFCYLDRCRLTETAERLRVDLHRIPVESTIVAHSMGALLTAYVGATDRAARLRNLNAVYLNPLIGGSWLADADPLLEALGDLRGLRWLHLVKRFIQRTVLPSFTQDLAPESSFIQQIFGSGRPLSSFRGQTHVVFTERPDSGPGLKPHRVARSFGCTREELVRRLGRLIPTPAALPAGHHAPLTEPRFVGWLVDSVAALSSDRMPHSETT